MQRLLVSSCLLILAVQPALAQAKKEAVSLAIPGLSCPAPLAIPHQRQQGRQKDLSDLTRSSYPRTHYQRGLYYNQTGDLNAALIEFLKATQENPRAVKAFYEQALIFHKRGYLKLAASSLEQALAADPNFRQARVLLAAIRLEQGNVSSAVQQLSSSLGLPSATPIQESSSRTGTKQQNSRPVGSADQPVCLPSSPQPFHTASQQLAPPAQQSEVENTDSADKAPLPTTAQGAESTPLNDLLKGIPGIDPAVPSATSAVAAAGIEANISSGPVGTAAGMCSESKTGVPSHKTWHHHAAPHLTSGSAGTHKSFLSHWHFGRLSQAPAANPAGLDLVSQKTKAHKPFFNWQPRSPLKQPPKIARLDHKAAKLKAKADTFRQKADNLGLATRKAPSPAVGSQSAKVDHKRNNEQASATRTQSDATRAQSSSLKAELQKTPWFAGLFSLFARRAPSTVPIRENNQTTELVNQPVKTQLEMVVRQPLSPLSQQVTSSSGQQVFDRQAPASQFTQVSQPEPPVERCAPSQTQPASTDPLSQPQQLAASHTSAYLQTNIESTANPNVTAAEHSVAITPRQTSAPQWSPSQLRWLSLPPLILDRRMNSCPSNNQHRTQQVSSPTRGQAVVEESWTKRLKYLATHGTNSLKTGEAFMFSEETGEATLFLATGETIRRNIATPQDPETVARLRRPDILVPHDLQYSLSLLGKLLPKQAEEPRSTESDQTNAFAFADVLQGSNKFWDWIRQSVHF